VAARANSYRVNHANINLLCKQACVHVEMYSVLSRHEMQMKKRTTLRVDSLMF